MTVNRKELCLLADMHLEQFKTASRPDPRTGLDDLPFAADEEIAAGFARYTAHDVIKLAVAVALNKAGGYLEGGLSFSRASQIAQNAPTHFVTQFELGGEGGFFVGYASHDKPSDGGRNMFGTWDEISDQIRPEPGQPPYTRFFLVDVVAVATAVHARSVRLGIVFDLGEI